MCCFIIGCGVLMGWSGGSAVGRRGSGMRSIDCILLQLLIFVLQLSQTTIQTLGIACVELMVSGSYSPRVNNVDLILLKGQVHLSVLLDANGQ